MRRVGSIIATLIMILFASAAAGPARADDAPAPNSDAFDTFDIYAQAQAARGTMFAVGGAEGESERLAGAKVEMSKPTNVFAVAAAFQRGLAAGYTYGAVFGRSAAGGLGVAPEPPPGESVALFPGEPTEMTWQGPVTQGAKGPVVDGQSYAKATAVPTGKSGISIQHIDVPGQLTIDNGVVASRGEPGPDGLTVESSSVLQGITIGKVLKIDRFTTRAYGLISGTGGDPKGEGTAVVTGASVNGVPVEITSGGIIVSDQKPQGGEQKAQLVKQVSESLAQANIRDVKLDESTVKPGDGGTSIQVTAALMRISYINNEFGAANPQGFRGGGFELGGATIAASASRATSPGGTTEASPDSGSSAPGGSPAAPAGQSEPRLAWAMGGSSRRAM